MSLPLVITAGDAGHISDHEEIHDILADVELADLWVVTRYLADVIASRGAAGREGSLYLATDEGAQGELYLDRNTGWSALWELMPNAEFDLRSGTSNDNLFKWRIPACRVGKTNTQAIASSPSTFEAVTWNDESGANFYDNDALHSISSNTQRFIASRAGIWICGTYIIWESNTTNQRFIRVQKNNATVLTREDRDASTGNDNMGLVAMIRLSVGDYVEFEVRQDSGVNLNVMPGSNAWFAFHSDD